MFDKHPSSSKYDYEKKPVEDSDVFFWSIMGLMVLLIIGLFL